MKFLGAFLALAVWASAYTLSNGVYTTDGSRSDVQAAIDASSDGNTVAIPAGTFTWTTPVTISGKAIKLRGAGADRVLARSDTSATVGTGTKTFTLVTESVPSNGILSNPLAALESLKDELTNGATVRIWRAGGEIDVNLHPSSWWGRTGNLPWMEGTVTSLSGTTLTMNITSTNYSGSHAPWIVTRKAATTIVVRTAGGEVSSGLVVSERVGGNVEISGIHFWRDDSAEAGYCLQLTDTPGAEPILLHDCSFRLGFNINGQMVRADVQRGVIWNCSFIFLPASHGSQNAVYLTSAAFSNSWTTVSTMGSVDTTGKTNFYIEASDFHFCDDAVDGCDQSRLVIRNSIFNNSGVGIHGPDTGTWGGRHYEIYDSEFAFSDPSGGTHAYAINGFLIPRGGTGLFTNNKVDDIVAYGSWGDKGEVHLQIQMLKRANDEGFWGANNDVPISGATVANPTVVTTSSAHGMLTGDYVRISGSNTTPTIDGYRQITKLTSTTYTVAVNVTVPGNTGKSNRVDYPAPRQIGMGYVTGAGLDGTGRSSDLFGYVGDSEPFYSWGNSGTWNQVVGVDGSLGYSGDATDPDYEGDYIIAGRDYFYDGTVKPGWTRYTYPHPLRTSDTPAAGVPTFQLPYPSILTRRR